MSSFEVLRQRTSVVNSQVLFAQERAREQLSRKYSSKQLSVESILTALYSISDNNSFLLFNRDPIVRVIDYLQVSDGVGMGG